MHALISACSCCQVQVPLPLLEYNGRKGSCKSNGSANHRVHSRKSHSSFASNLYTPALNLNNKALSKELVLPKTFKT
uniref:Ovule protein n=1 Tax=Panagrolaimus sp. ES5 TaxID=591445 RepID=A0AC34FNX9_9BILA